MVCGLSALLFASCASDEPIAPDNNVTTQDGDFYASLTLRLPSFSGTRAVEGGYSGTEIGQDSENTVQNVLVVLASKDDNGRFKYLTQAKASKTDISGSSNLTYNFNFNSSELNRDPLATGSTLPGQEVYVFVYANPTALLNYRFNGNTNFVFENAFGELGSEGYTGAGGSKDHDMWTPDNFLMSNSKLVSVKLPSRDELVHKHNTAATAFNLGTVDVKRVCARFDFATTNSNKYDIKDIDGESIMGTVELTDMAMFNIQKQFYYLPHVSTNGWNWTEVTDESAVNYTLCGDLEDFVMSFNIDNFKGVDKLVTKYRDYYYCNIIGNSLEMGKTGGNYLDWVSIRPIDWNKQTQDKNETISEGVNSWNPDDSDYRIWRYTTENTIPGFSSGNKPEGSQRQGITTGVVFKAEFHPKDTEKWNGNVVYVHNSIVYGDFESLKAYVEKNPNSVVAADFKKVEKFNTATAGSDLKVNLLSGISDDEHHDFVAYPVKDGKYYMYYFYFNRHKTNGDNTVMSDDEFGVVRNNVYKLRVTSIGALGKPKAPDDPNEEDEQEQAFFKVDCRVLPWSVRVNNIEF